MWWGTLGIISFGLWPFESAVGGHTWQRINQTYSFSCFSPREEGRGQRRREERSKIRKSHSFMSNCQLGLLALSLMLTGTVAPGCVRRDRCETLTETRVPVENPPELRSTSHHFHFLLPPLVLFTSMPASPP